MIWLSCYVHRALGIVSPRDVVDWVDEPSSVRQALTTGDRFKHQCTHAQRSSGNNTLNNSGYRFSPEYSGILKLQAYGLNIHNIA